MYMYNRSWSQTLKMDLHQLSKTIIAIPIKMQAISSKVPPLKIIAEINEAAIASSSTDVSNVDVVVDSADIQCCTVLSRENSREKKCWPWECFSDTSKQELKVSDIAMQKPTIETICANEQSNNRWWIFSEGLHSSISNLLSQTTNCSSWKGDYRYIDQAAGDIFFQIPGDWVADDNCLKLWNRRCHHWGLRWRWLGPCL